MTSFNRSVLRDPVWLLCLMLLAMLLFGALMLKLEDRRLCGELLHPTKTYAFPRQPYADTGFVPCVSPGRSR